MKSTLTHIAYLINEARVSLKKGHNRKADDFLVKALGATNHENRRVDHYYIMAKTCFERLYLREAICGHFKFDNRKSGYFLFEKKEEVETFKESPHYRDAKDWLRKHYPGAILITVKVYNLGSSMTPKEHREILDLLNKAKDSNHAGKSFTTEICLGTAIKLLKKTKISKPQCYCVKAKAPGVVLYLGMKVSDFRTKPWFLKNKNDRYLFEKTEHMTNFFKMEEYHDAVKALATRYPGKTFRVKMVTIYLPIPWITIPSTL